MDNAHRKFKAKVGSVQLTDPGKTVAVTQSHRANLQMQMSNIKPDADDVSGGLRQF